MKKNSTICKDIQMVLTVIVLIAAVQFMNSCGGGDGETTTVVIDNHVYVMTVQDDASVSYSYIAQSFPTYNFGSCENFVAGFSPAWGRVKGLIKFHLENVPLPSNITVREAYLTLYTLRQEYEHPVACYEILADWTPGTACAEASTSGVTWSTSDGTAAWTGGGEVNVEAMSDVKNSGNYITTDSSMTFKLDAAIVHRWISNSATNHGLMVDSFDDLNPPYIVVYGQNTEGKGPKLTIYYTLN